MIIYQLSVFLENKPGRVSAALETLSDNNIDISALSLADTEEYGIMRLIVDNPELAKQVLNDAGVIVKINHVIAIAMSDVPGGAGKIMRILADAGVNVEYLYAFVGKVSGKALMVLRTDDQKKAENILNASGYNTVEVRDIYRI